MKRLSDYKGEAAIELWADLLDPLTAILADKDVQASIRGGESTLSKAKTILKSHKADAEKILLTVDPTPIDGLNMIARLVSLVLEIENSEVFADFFESPSTERTESESFGSVTAITEAKEN